MTQYKKVNVNLTENQIKKLDHELNANCASISLKLGKNDLEGGYPLFLTNAQHRKLENARDQGKGLTIRMSSRQLKYNMKTEGGFLGALVPALAGIGRAVAPALLGIAKSGSSFSNRCPFWFSFFRSR